MSAPFPLLARRAANRASLRATSANTNPSLPPPSPSPFLTPLLPGALLPNNSLANFPWHTATPPPTPATPPPRDPHWPQCPIEGHKTCVHGAVYYYANSYPGRQQRKLLEQGGFGADFFEYGNPPPAVWAAVWRVLQGVIEKRDLDLVYEYRLNHCPRRRKEIVAATLQGVEGEAAALRLRMAKLGIDHRDDGMGRIDVVMRG